MSQRSANRRRRRPTDLAVILWMVCAVGASRLTAQVAVPAHPVDLISAKRDLNGLLLNPTWEQPGAKDVAQECGFLAGPGEPGYRVLVLRDTSCYHGSKTILRLVEPRATRALGTACLQGSQSAMPHGHVNWDVVTMTGRADWLGFAPDGDYNFALQPDTTVALTVGNVESGGIELELNAYETVMRMKNTASHRWWSRLRALADHHSADSSHFEGLSVIVSGLFGVDGVHSAPVELHPVFALFAKVDSGPQMGGRWERWAFLVRNLGDEGMCSYGQIPFELRGDASGALTYRALIPAPPSAVSTSVDWDGRRSWVATTNSAASGPYFAADARHDVEVTLRLPAPDPTKHDALIYGEFTLEWRVPAAFAALPMKARTAHRRLRHLRERRPENQLKRPANPRVTDFCDADTLEVARDIGLVRTHWRSCDPEIATEPSHGTTIDPRPLDSLPPRAPQAAPVWPDYPEVVVCGDRRIPTATSCQHRHQLELGIGFLADPDGPRVSSASLSPIDLQPGEWGTLPGPLAVLSDVLGIRPVALTADWYDRVNTSGAQHTVLIGSAGPRVFGSLQPIPLWSAVRLEIAAGPALVMTKDTAAAWFRLGAVASAHLRAGLGTGGLTIGARRMMRPGPDTWAVLVGVFALAPW